LAVEPDIDIWCTRWFWRPSNLKQAKTQGSSGGAIAPRISVSSLRQGRIPEAEINVHDRSTS
jgi:hypothetical protein